MIRHTLSVLFLAAAFVLQGCVLDGNAADSSVAGQKKCCEEEIRNIQGVIKDDATAQAILNVSIDESLRGKKEIRAGILSCWEESGVLKCEIDISEKLYQAFAKDELYAVLAHEVCHVADGDTQKGIEREYRADECSVGVLSRLKLNPRAALAALKRMRADFPPLVAPNTVWQVNRRIRRLEEVLEKLENR